MRAKFLWVVLVGLLSGSAWADRDGRGHRHSHGHAHWGIQIGTPWPSRPVYPYWPRIHVPPSIVYIEQIPAVVPAPATGVPMLEPGYWYYCKESDAYYPQVKQCAGDWHKVSPPPAR